MLAYAAHRRRIAERHSAPQLMLAIIAGHVALIAAVMSAKMDLPERIRDATEVILISVPPPPPFPDPQPRVPPSTPSTIDRTPVIVPVPQRTAVLLDSTPVPSLPNIPLIQPRFDPRPTPGIAAKAPVRIGPRFATPQALLRPPYPSSKIASEEEAVLRLRLSIDHRGRVVAVEPAGPADPAFLAAARRHLLARWRYTPATEDGRAVASSTVITLRFQLEG